MEYLEEDLFLFRAMRCWSENIHHVQSDHFNDSYFDKIVDRLCTETNILGIVNRSFMIRVPVVRSTRFPPDIYRQRIQKTFFEIKFV